MGDNQSNPHSPSPSTANLPPPLHHPLSKTQPTHQVTQLEQGLEQLGTTSVKWMSKQKATAIGHFTKLRHRGRASPQVEVAMDSGADPAEQPSQSLPAPLSPRDNLKNDMHVDSSVANDPGQFPPEPVGPNTLAKRMQDMFSTIPSFTPSIGSSSPQSTLPTLQTEADDNPSPARDSRSLPFLTLPNFENGPLEHGWKSFCSALDRLRPPHMKTPSSLEPSRNDVLDCIDDNNSVMMYGPLEPDDTSEVEIACSEIISINGDGEEIRTPQPCYSPLPSESVDEASMGRGPRSPPPRYVALPLESTDTALGGRSPRSPSPRFVPLPLESIGQVLMGGRNGVSGIQWKASESEIVPETANPADEPPAVKLPVREYRVWLPSPTKISVQTMWWGFRIYLPPPVLDVLNNKQLEAAKRAALITTALQWLMEHLPVSLLPPQMLPGVAILRHLVPYVGYMGGFIAWTWSAIRSFDKGYGVVLTATWLLPFLLIPGTWEADEVTNLNTDPQSSPSVSS